MGCFRCKQFISVKLKSARAPLATSLRNALIEDKTVAVLPVPGIPQRNSGPEISLLHIRCLMNSVTLVFSRSLQGKFCGTTEMCSRCTAMEKTSLSNLSDSLFNKLVYACLYSLIFRPRSRIVRGFTFWIALLSEVIKHRQT